MTRPARPDRPPLVHHLARPLRSPGLPIVLICFAVYALLVSPTGYPYAGYVCAALTFAALAAFLGASRLVIYAVLAAALATYLFAFVHVVANGPQDEQSTRDDAVEQGTWALSRGENSWRVNLGTPPTTGPASILLALPFVLTTGHVNWLSFLFWLVLFGFLLVNDLSRDGERWPVFVVIFILGLFDFRHTITWSLDELYYPMVYLAFAYVLAERRRWFWTGAWLAAAVLSRSNYAFLVAGFVLWCLTNGLDRRGAVALAAGSIGASAAILLPFVLVNGRDLWAANPWRFALEFAGSGWPETNAVFHLMNLASTAIGASATRLLKIGVTLAIMWFVTTELAKRRVSHPFWHVTAAALVAHTLVWLPATLPSDYTLMVVLPAMLAISSSGAAGSSDRPARPGSSAFA